MNKIRTIIGLAAVALLALSTLTTKASDLYRADELNIDLYGAYTAAEPNGIDEVLKTNAEDGDYGAGIGVSYFITRNFGTSFETTIPSVDDVSGTLFEDTKVSFIARLPIGHVSPYGAAGIGRNWDREQFTTHVRAGLEVRFNDSAGVFTDAAYVWESSRVDQLFARAGLRFAF